MRITANLSLFFHDHRSLAKIFIHKRIKCIKDVEDHIGNIFNIQNFYLKCENQFLPPGEDVQILNNDEVVWAVPLDEHETSFDQNNLILNNVTELEESSPVEKKRKKKKRHETYFNQDLVNDVFELEEAPPVEKKRKKKRKHEIFLNQNMVNNVIESEESAPVEKKKKKKKKHQEVEETKEEKLLEPDKVSNICENNILHKQKKVKLEAEYDNSIVCKGISEDKKEVKIPQDLAVEKKSKDHTTANAKNEIKERENDSNTIKNKIKLKSENLKETEVTGKSYNNINVNKSHEKLETKEVVQKEPKAEYTEGNSSTHGSVCESEQNSTPSTKDESIDCGDKWSVCESISKPKGQTKLKLKREYAENEDNEEIDKIKVDPKSFVYNKPQASFKEPLANGKNTTSATEENINVKKLVNTFEKNKFKRFCFTNNELARRINIVKTIVISNKQNTPTNNSQINSTVNSPVVSTPQSDVVSSNTTVDESNTNTAKEISEVSEQNSIEETSSISDYHTPNGLDTNNRKRKRKRTHRKKRTMNDSGINATFDNFVYETPTEQAPMHVRFDDAPTENNEAVAMKKEPEESPEKIRNYIVRNLEVKRNDKALEECILKQPITQNIQPRLGDVIAFKILRISEDYTPEVSSSIVGKVRKYEEGNKEITFDIVYGQDQCGDPQGKFSLDLEEEARDGNNNKFHCVWSSLLEPRLIFP